MTNRIVSSRITGMRLSPTEADIRISVQPQSLFVGTEVRGRWVGPRCAYASTVEVAYPLREQERTHDAINLRVLIPEPSLWDPQSPFLYQEMLELWQDNTLCERISRQQGLRTFQVTKAGLIWNGKPLSVKGLLEPPASEEEFRVCRQEGYSLLDMSAEKLSPSLLDLADIHGFLVLGRDGAPAQIDSVLAGHACWLGFLADFTSTPRNR